MRDFLATLSAVAIVLSVIGALAAFAFQVDARFPGIAEVLGYIATGFALLGIGIILWMRQTR